ncbi:MAG TPA: hypothetical protein VEG60_30260 [Candidatus Binatia bacterium]|nr:hypothetical protein [Candidatus Binatia bacterium]
MKKTLSLGFGSYIILLLAILAGSGCESIARPPRPDVDRRGIERTPDARGIARDEIIGTVDRVDRSRNEIQLRTTEAKVIIIRFDPATRVYSREREVGIDALRPGDLILVIVAKTPGGEQYADLIRLNDRTEQ